MGVKGACPLMLPPPLGERGGHPRNFHASSKNSRGFLQSPFLMKENRIFLFVIGLFLSDKWEADENLLPRENASSGTMNMRVVTGI